MSKTKLIGFDKKSLIGVEETVKMDDKRMFEPEISKTIDKEFFYKCLEGFSKEDHRTVWDNVSIETDRYHIRIFTYSEDQKVEDVESTILAFDADNNLVKARDLSTNEKFTHVAKIIKVGSGLTNPKYAVDDIILLNKAEVCGKAPNPTYIQVLQYSKGFGGEQPILPPNTPKTVPAIQARFQEYYITLPEDFDLPTHKIFDFVIPEFKITGKFTI